MSIKNLDHFECIHVNLKSGNFAEKTYFVCSELSKVLQISFHFKKTYWYGKNLKRHMFTNKKSHLQHCQLWRVSKKKTRLSEQFFIKLKRSKNWKRLIFNLWKWATLRNPKRRILRGLKNIVLNFSTKLLGMKVGSANLHTITIFEFS